jgi:hypothetical protein
VPLSALTLHPAPCTLATTTTPPPPPPPPPHHHHHQPHHHHTTPHTTPPTPHTTATTPQGKYLLVKDPSKELLRLYAIPDDAFESNYAEEPLEELALAPPPAAPAKDDKDE